MLIDELVMKPEVNQRLLSRKGKYFNWDKTVVSNKPIVTKSHKKHDGYTEYQWTVIEYIYEVKKAKIKEIEKGTGLGYWTVHKALAALIKVDVIKKAGDTYHNDSYMIGDVTPSQAKKLNITELVIKEAKERGSFTAKDLLFITPHIYSTLTTIKNKGLIKKFGRTNIWLWVE